MDELGPDVPLHFTAFHPDWKMIDKPHTPAATLTRARDDRAAQRPALRYTGNVHEAPAAARTARVRGAAHRARLVRAQRWNLAPAGAAHVRHAVPGVFETRPGRWGARRLAYGSGTSRLDAQSKPRLRR